MLAGGQSSDHQHQLAGGRYPCRQALGQIIAPVPVGQRRYLGRNNAPKGRVGMCNNPQKAWGGTRRPSICVASTFGNVSCVCVSLLQSA